MNSFLSYSSTSSSRMSSYLISETDFSLNLLRRLIDETHPSESIVFSPLSISLGLCLVHTASDKKTRNQIRDVLLKDSIETDFEQYFSEISTELLEAKGGVEVKVTNHIFCRNDLEIKQPYLDKIKKLYNSGASSLDFNDKKGSVDFINDFVYNNTNKQIKLAISGSTIQNDIEGILVNGLYFKASWREKFDPSQTSKKTFFTAPDLSRQADFLNKTTFRGYAENSHFQVLQLPFLNKSFAMNIFLPKERFGLKKLLTNIESKSVQNLLASYAHSYVNIQIPKWKILSTFDLEKVLEELGIRNFFRPTKSDFGNMADGMKVLSKVAHSAQIEVDENGTTASAALWCLKGAEDPPKPIDFIADHPFLFMITKDNHPIFIGIHN